MKEVTETNPVYYHLYVGSFKKKILNIYNKRETDLVIENKLVDTSGEREVERARYRGKGLRDTS